MARRVILKAAYRVLRPVVAGALVATFVICIVGGMVIEKFTHSTRALFILFALAFLAQAAVFLGVRFIPAVRIAAANPALAEQQTSLVLGIGLMSLILAAFLGFFAFE